MHRIPKQIAYKSDEDSSTQRHACPSLRSDGETKGRANPNAHVTRFRCQSATLEQATVELSNNPRLIARWRRALPTTCGGRQRREVRRSLRALVRSKNTDKRQGADKAGKRQPQSRQD